MTKSESGLKTNLTIPSGAGILFGIALFIFGLIRYISTVIRLDPSIVIDDCYITYRYAENWASGFGPVWNVGGQPVEGYSTPLYMTLLALGKVLLPIQIPELSKLLCLIFGVGTLAVFFLLAFRVLEHWAWALAATGYLAANAVVEDKGINKWWKEPEMVTRAREKGLL